MARIRTIKPELFKHDDLFELEVVTGLPIRLAFVGLWCCCDREGRFKWKPRQLKTDILPYDDVDFSRVLDALATRGFVVKYASEGAWFGCVPSFTTHQVINNREQASILPGPDDADGVEPAIPGLPDDQVDACPTRAPRVTHAASGEGKGREGKGREGEKPSSSLSAEVLDVFGHWQQVMGKARAKLDDKRRKLIKARLDSGYSVDDLKQAITGCSFSPYHMGENENGSRYDGLDLILRDGSKVDQFIGYFRQPPRPRNRNDVNLTHAQHVIDEFAQEAPDARHH